MKEIQNPIKLIDELKEEVDGIFVSPRLAKRLKNLKNIPNLFIRADGAISKLNPNPERWKIICSPKRAKKLKAKDLICMGYVGAKSSETQSLENVAKLASKCETLNLTLMAEMLPLKKVLEPIIFL